MAIKKGPSRNITVNFVGDVRHLQEAFSKAASGSQSFASKVQADGQQLAKWSKMAVAAVSAVGSTLWGLSLKGGISRAMAIEDAQAKLRGLGHDAQNIEKIMVSALDSVRGTAFGLGDAAGAAASAVAAGVEMGEPLTDYLKLVADTATIAGVGLNEMASIFAKVQTQGRAYTMEINQLADRNIPIWQWLQDELGVTQDALRKMVAAGQVDAATYRKAIANNISGAALESGNTTRGAYANMLAAASRFGERLIRDVFPLAKRFFSGIQGGFDDLSDRVGPILDRFAQSDAFAALQRGIRDLPDLLEDTADGLVEVWEATEGVRAAIGNVAAGGAQMVRWVLDFNKALGGLPAILTAVSFGLKALWAHPVIAGLALVALAVGEIGREARESRAEVQRLYDEIQHGSTTGADQVREFTDALAVNDTSVRALREVGLTIADVKTWFAEAAGSGETFLAYVARIGAVRPGQQLSNDFFAVNRAIQEQADLLAAVAKLRTEEATERAGEIQQQRIDRDAARRGRYISEETQALTDLTDAHRRARDEARHGQRVNQDVVRAYEEVGDAVSATAEQLEALEAGGALIRDEFQEAVDAAQRLGDEAAKPIDAFVDGFNALPERTDVGLAAFTKNLSDRLNEAKTFWENYKIVAAVDQDFADTVREAGVEGGSQAMADAAQAIVDGKDDLVTAAGDLLRQESDFLAEVGGFFSDPAIASAEQTVIDKMTELGDATGITREQVQGLIDDLLRLRGQARPHGLTGVEADALGIARRAGGGRVTAGTPYLVGELRPEVFIPDRSGSIHPDADRYLGALLRGGGGGAPSNTITISVDARGATDPDKVAYAVRREFNREQRIFDAGATRRP